MANPCRSGGSTRWFYTGNQVGDFNFTGDFNFVAGGPPGSGIAAGTLASLFFPSAFNRAIWEAADASLNQDLLDNTYPFVELNFICDFTLKDTVFRVSNKNIYVEDRYGVPRFYEARVGRAPSFSITQGEWLAPNFEIGDLTIKMNNRDGFFNDYLPQGPLFAQWIGAKVEIRVGFGEHFENYFNIFTGFVAAKKGVETTDQEIMVKCYDMFDDDELPIPAQQFDEATYPDIDDNYKGKPIPLVYGDWTVDINDFGDIPGIVTNAFEEDASFYYIKIADNSLRSIDNIYLHRGKRIPDTGQNPIEFDPLAITLDLDNGRVIIPAIGPVLLELYDLIDKDTAGSGSGLNTIAANSPSTNFLTKGVKSGDTVTKLSTGEKVTVNTVAAAMITTIGGVTFSVGDDYAISTNQYSFLKGDKISVKCKGKKTNNLSINRLSDAGLTSAVPIGLSLTLNGSYFFADDDAQKIYEVNFYNEVVREIDYSDIDASITSVKAVSFQNDNSLWILSNGSKIWRFLLETNAVGLSFTTADIPAIGVLLADMRGLTIDDGNIITFIDNSTGQFYVINPFAAPTITLDYTWNITAFDASATDVMDLSADVNQNHIVVIDRNTKKVYRLDYHTGALIVDSDFLYEDEVSDNLTFPVGISSSQDGTIFILDRSSNSIYNYNEATDASENPAWIARDIIQKMAGKVPNDFDLLWNQTAREDMSQFKTRIYFKDKANVVSFCSKLLQQFNCSLYIHFQRYSLFYIHFDNFRTDGHVIGEGDIKMGSFNPSKEYNQYFNSATAEFNYSPFNSKPRTSDTYISPAGILASGKELPKKLTMSNVYRREDMDQLMPLFVRLAVPEPEFLNFTTSFKFLFTQLNDFFNLNFSDPIDCDTGLKSGGRRFDNIPIFIRKIDMDLEEMTLKFKAWSLGTTAFGDFTPVGNPPGGENDSIILTNLGTPGYISPTGTITASTINSVDLAMVDGDDAESREEPVVGRAWSAGMVLALIDATDHSVVETAVIQDVSGNTITFVDNLSIAPTPSVLNTSGFISSGHYLRYASYEDVSIDQRTHFAYFGRPIDNYPTTTTQETEEQRAGLHNFENDRLPYILHPFGFTPS